MAVCGLLLESNAATAKLARLIDPDNSNNNNNKARDEEGRSSALLPGLPPTPVLR